MTVKQLKVITRVFNEIAIKKWKHTINPKCITKSLKILTISRIKYKQGEKKQLLKRVTLVHELPSGTQQGSYPPSIQKTITSAVSTLQY